MRYEEGAMNIVRPALKRYEEHFDEPFPLDEHRNLLKDETYDVSLNGAMNFSSYVDQCILNDKKPMR